MNEQIPTTSDVTYAIGDRVRLITSTEDVIGTVSEVNGDLVTLMWPDSHNPCEYYACDLEKVPTLPAHAAFSVIMHGWYGQVLLLSADQVPTTNDVGERGQMWTVLSLGNSQLRPQTFVPDTAVIVAHEDMVVAPSDAIASVYAQLITAREAFTHIRDQYHAFKDKARDAIIRGWKISNAEYGSNMCRDGLNSEMLRPLGLDEYEPTHQVSVTITATVEADDESEAWDILRGAVSVRDDRVSDVDFSEDY